MQALVVYDTKFGHTEQLALAIGDVLSSRYDTRVVPALAANLGDAASVDLLVIGGPTHAHGMSVPLRQLLEGLDRGSLRGVAAATFDTRFHMPRWLSGSAARSIARRLRRAGCELVTEPESFFVARTKDSPLLPGELERATTWAGELLNYRLQVAAQH